MSSPAKINHLLILLLFLLIFYSCDSKRIFEENKKIEKGVWNTADKANFEVNITDIYARYNFYINVRNEGDYPYSNLYLFMHTLFPDGTTARDTIECQLADYDGRWLGSGIGSVKYNRFLFKQGVKFRQPGTYVFELEQAMRTKELKGVADIGIRVEKQ